MKNDVAPNLRLEGQGGLGNMKYIQEYDEKPCPSSKIHFFYLRTYIFWSLRTSEHLSVFTIV